MLVVTLFAVNGNSCSLECSKTSSSLEPVQLLKPIIRRIAAVIKPELLTSVSSVYSHQQGERLDFLARLTSHALVCHILPATFT